MAQTETLEIIDADKLTFATEAAIEDSIGFAADAFDAHAVLEGVSANIRHYKPGDYIDTWRVLPTQDRSGRLQRTQADALRVITKFSPESNLDFIHLLQPPWSGDLGWHRDVTPDDMAGAGYEKGRFRVAFNLTEGATVVYRSKDDKEIDTTVEPGTLYVIDYTHNPWHKSICNDNLSADRLLLLMTDVARYADVKLPSEGAE